jgi:hypothetical protein
MPNSFELVRAQERTRVLAGVVAHIRSAISRSETINDARLTRELAALERIFLNEIPEEGDGVDKKSPLLSKAFARVIVIRDIVDLATLAIEACERDTDLNRFDDKRAENKHMPKLNTMAKNIKGFYASEARRVR